MARKPTLTQAQLDELRAEYEAWNPYDPEAPSADEIAARHGVSKNTMYTWRSRGWSLTGRDGDGSQGWKQRSGQPSVEPRADENAGAIRYLAEQLVLARIELTTQQREIDRLRERVENDKSPATRMA